MRLCALVLLVMCVTMMCGCAEQPVINDIYRQCADTMPYYASLSEWDRIQKRLGVTLDIATEPVVCLQYEDYTVSILEYAVTPEYFAYMAKITLTAETGIIRMDGGQYYENPFYTSLSEYPVPVYFLCVSITTTGVQSIVQDFHITEDDRTMYVYECGYIDPWEYVFAANMLRWEVCEANTIENPYQFRVHDFAFEIP